MQARAARRLLHNPDRRQSDNRQPLRGASTGIARKHAVSIIEDDPYGVLLEGPPTAIASLGPDITWHIATLSKCLTPTLCYGYVAAPTPEQAQELAGTLQAMTMMASPLLAGIA
ncbi:hypothetical protein [Kaistia defluvii]|uniref:DNA-binding transcriptional MocR family regulator n=1 Tax=Kaistia defluvii TaxID=410841 RepID=A0ABV2R5P6_9HYPH